MVKRQPETKKHTVRPLRGEISTTQKIKPNDELRAGEVGGERGAIRGLE